MHVTFSWPEFIYALTTCDIMLCIWVAAISGQVYLGLLQCKNIMEIFGVFISTLLGVALEAVGLNQIFIDN